MMQCNCCNALLKQVGFCHVCGCPESRIVKPQRWFLTMVRPDCKDSLIAWVQQMCAEPFMKEIIAVGPWTFEIEKHDVHGWWCLYAKAEYEIWDKLYGHHETMRKWLDAKYEENERKCFPDSYGVSDEGKRIPSTDSQVPPDA